MAHDTIFVMKHLRYRFVHRVSLGLGIASIMISSMFLACETDSTSARVTAPDAAPTGFETPDATTDSSVGYDAFTDAGKDAFVAVHADVTKDFATSANPNGAWTYGYSLTDPTGAQAGTMVAFDTVSTATPDEAAWYDPAIAVLGAPAAWRNDSAAVANGIAPGEFAIHPGSAGEYAVVRWTAPAAGAYAVTLQFKTGDTGDTNGLLLHNGAALVTEASTSTDAVHELQVTLAAGDRLDVAVGSKGDFYSDSTPVHLTIRTAGSDP